MDGKGFCRSTTQNSSTTVKKSRKIGVIMLSYLIVIVKYFILGLFEGWILICDQDLESEGSGHITHVSFLDKKSMDKLKINK